MSGRKQHHIPQLLLKGFKAKHEARHIQVYVFKAGRDPFLSSIEGVAAARDFYSSPSHDGQKTLDDQITEYENKQLADLLQNFRGKAHGEAVNANEAIELVVHLVVRGAFTREVFECVAHEIFGGISGIFGNPEQVRRHMGIDGNDPHPAFTEEVNHLIKQFQSAKEAPLPYESFRKIIHFMLRENFDSLFAANQNITPAFSEYKEQIVSAIKSGHAKVLQQELVPKYRVEQLKHLRWQVLHTPEDMLILPDCVAISITKGNAASFQPAIFIGEDLPEQLFLPLSANQMLVGTADQTANLDIDEFNLAAASCSFTFFVSSRNTKDIQRLTPSIGNHTKTNALSEVRTALESLNTPYDRSVQSAEAKLESGAPADYPVSFFSCANQKTAEEVSKTVNVLVSVFGRNLPLQRLDGVIFAEDYTNTLRDLDRGDPNLPSLAPTESAQEVGIAMAPIVIRQGQIRTCVVCQGWLVAALNQQEDETAFLSSLYTIASMLGRVAYNDLFDSSLPGVLLRPHQVENNLDRFLYPYIDDISSTYFACRVSAEIYPEAEAALYKLLLFALERLFTEIPKARLAYRTDGNLDKFLSIMMPAISKLLNRASAVLGHIDGLDRELLKNDDVSIVLQQYGLRSWLDVYQRDLKTIYDRQGQWTSIDEFVALSRHVERLMWQLGSIPWETPEGQLRIDMPLAVDQPALDKLFRQQHNDDRLG